MDPKEKKKSIFDADAIIQLLHKGEAKKVFYNQISSSNIALAFNLTSTEGVFLRRLEVCILIFNIYSNF